MKFRGILTPNGISLLEKRFLPAFEKIGRACHVYITPEDFFLMHNLLTSDGAQAIAQFPRDVLFSECRVTSQNNDRIAFTLDLALFGRALRSGSATDSGRMLMKLVKKSPTSTERAMPFLSIESKGFRSAIVQDIPISQPLTRSEVAELQSSIDAVQSLPRTLVEMPDLLQLQLLTDRLRNVGDVLEVAVLRSGSLALRTATPAVCIASEFRGLRVWAGEEAGPAMPLQQSLDEADSDISGLSSRLRRMQASGDASVASVNLKLFARSLQCHLTKPDASFCGIAPNESCFLMMFQYADNAVSLQYRLPLMDSG